MKIPDRLLPLLEEGLIQEVVRPLMSGKEAAVYIVHDGEGYRVAKVYKEAQTRSFRQRTAYTDGRQVRNSRDKRAMDRGSKYGKAQTEKAWQNAEVDALFRLDAAGVRVPKARIFYEGVLIMDLVLDPNGEPAPRFADVDFTPEEAWNCHGWLMREIVRMLCAGLIHGDLSAFNVLLAWDGPMIIDLPQAIDAANSNMAKQLLLRDVDNITQFLGRFAPELLDSRYGQEIWSLYESARLAPDTPLTGRWRGPNRRVDERALLREVRAVAEDRGRLRR